MAIEQALDVISKANMGLPIESLDSYDSNELLIAIIKLRKYGLLSFNDITFNFQNEESLNNLIKLLLKDDDYIYFCVKNGMKISQSDLERIRLIAFKFALESYSTFSNYFYSFFSSPLERDIFIKNNRDLFISVLQSGVEDIFGCISELNSFINIVLSVGRTDLISKISFYSAENMKLLIDLIRKGYIVKYYYADADLFNNIFNYKEELTYEEFFEILKLFTEDNSYTHSYGNCKGYIELINENIGYLFECISHVGIVPLILAKTVEFREECIRRNRMDLAVQCIVPKDLINNEELLNKYSQELNISVDELKKRLEWVSYYSLKNKDVYDLMITSMLRDKIVNIPMHHYERFVNDTGIQMKLTNLNKKELDVVLRLLNETDYKNYDVSFMISTILNNITKYNELINTLEVSEMNDVLFGNLIIILMDSNNYYNVRSIDDLVRFNEIKKEKYIECGSTDDIDTLKEGMVKYLFNIDLSMAQYLNNKYCYDRERCFIDELENSELSRDVFDILKTLNSIVDCTSIEELKEKYLSIGEPYKIVLPLETILRREYSLLYSKSLYRVENEDKKEKDDPTKAAKRDITYGDKKVEMYIPKDDFRFFIHCLGTCSTDLINEQFDKEWLEYPQVRDHFVACSFISSEKMELRSEKSVIYGFNSLEGGSLLGMGDTDIDSIGDSRYYNGGYNLMVNNGERAHFFTPSMLLKKIDGYNELVIERRNNNGSLTSGFKRRPDYIIMMVDTIEDESNFITFTELKEKELGFLTEEEMNKIKEARYKNDIADIIAPHARELITYVKIPEGQKLTKKFVVNKYAERITKAILYENNLKAASDFGIPIVTIDKSYYLRKMMMQAKCYDKETIDKVINYYLASNDGIKRDIIERVRRHVNYEEIIKTNDGNKIITISV